MYAAANQHNFLFHQVCVTAGWTEAAWNNKLADFSIYNSMKLTKDPRVFFMQPSTWLKHILFTVEKNYLIGRSLHDKSPHPPIHLLKRLLKGPTNVVS